MLILIIIPILDMALDFGHGIGFDTRGTFLLSNGSGFGKNVIMFELILELIIVFLYILITERKMI